MDCARNTGVGIESHPEQFFYLERADMGFVELLVVHMPCVDVSSLLIHVNT